MTKKRKNQEVKIHILFNYDLIIFVFVGFGFLSFEDEDAVDRCVSEHFVNLNGKQVCI